MSQAQFSTQYNSEAGSVADGNTAQLMTVVYRSRAVTPLSVPDLYRLTMSSQARNRQEALTGVMVYDDSRFFQWIEGPSEGVERVMHSIRNDPRHTDIEILNDRATRERAFGDWNMKLATRAPKSAWSDEILKPSAKVMHDLRQHPGAAPTLLIKLAPRSGDARADTTSASDETSHAPLGRATAAILKDVILKAVIPNLSRKHGVTNPGSNWLPARDPVLELAELLIASDQGAARELIDELHAAEGSIWPLYSALFEPAARRLGDLWSEDLCSEFDVTLGLCRIQTAVRLLSAHARPKFRRGLPVAAVLISPEPGELHHLGAALDSEVLWNAGWVPHCEYPADDKAMQDLVSTTWFDALDVSLSAAFQREHLLPNMTKTIADARRASLNPALLVVVGGRIFADHKTSGDQVGADVTSTTALNVDDLILRGIAKRNDREQPDV